VLSSTLFHSFSLLTPSHIETKSVQIRPDFVLACALSGLLAHLGLTGVRSALIAGFGIWLGFILPSLATNIIFQRRNKKLIWQDGLHWLLILTSQGVVLGLLS